MIDGEAIGREGRSIRSASALGVDCENLPAALAQFVEVPAPTGPLAVVRTANDLVDMTVDFGHETIPPIPAQIRTAQAQISEGIARLTTSELRCSYVELGVQPYAIECGVRVTVRREHDLMSQQADELVASIDFDQKNLPFIDDDVQADDDAAYESIVEATLNQLSTDIPDGWGRTTVESLRCAVALHLAKIGDGFLRTSEDAVVPLAAPILAFSGAAVSEFDEMTVWRADLEMTDVEDGSDVVCGYVEFLILKVGTESVVEMLDSWSQAAVTFAGLFDGNEVAAEVSAQFDGELFNRVLIITQLFVAEPARGHSLGAWAVSEVAERMASPSDTLVLLYPFWIVARSGDFDELAAVEALTKYWGRCGLVPIDAHPQFLGQSTSYNDLPQARSPLAEVRDLRLAIPAEQVNEQPLSSQRTLIPNDEN
ncbi:Uncharacterised protein [Mycobacteroides abscessus subsp. abscessus]|uniref:hypothetical protein n=1 Tax=Mycobacteroides abscessus TaxID=36809 RepID=UPI00092A41EA|nr:hypothetical protein [Mycobacteroides abscessus]SIH37586.1 Uncharacterised protein [Mycobacteroides abscessus subsp. abscessus]